MKLIRLSQFLFICLIGLLSLILPQPSYAAVDCSQFNNKFQECVQHIKDHCIWKNEFMNQRGECVVNTFVFTPTPPPPAPFSSFMEAYNPLSADKNFDTLGSIINALLPFLFSGAGLILLGMLIMGGFGLMTAGTDAKKADAAKGRITAAIIGFVIIFAAYWITQILEIVLGVKILGG